VAALFSISKVIRGREGKGREGKGREGKGREGKEKAFAEQWFSRGLGWSGIVYCVYYLHRNISLPLYDWQIRKKNGFYLSGKKLSKVVPLHNIKANKTLMIQFHPFLIYIELNGQLHASVVVPYGRTIQKPTE
jgi:hypothetical protein